MRTLRQKGFTLVELLIVIGILSIISTATVLVINPLEYLNRARDSQRINDLLSINQALQLGSTFASLNGQTLDYDGVYSGGCIGSADGGPDRLFVSVPSGNGEITPSDGSVLGYSSWEGLIITQVISDDSSKLDSSGWIPVNITSAFQPQPTPISRLPLDPINTFEGGYYYSYVCGSYAIAAKMQSEDFSKIASSDGGNKPNHYETGSDVSALPNTLPEAISQAGDTTAPAAVTNLTASNETASSITLSWTAPGDDDMTGTATSYDIRYSTSLQGDWDSATQVTGEPEPQEAGGSEAIIVSGLSPNTTYYFALKTEDEAENISGFSNIAIAITQPLPDSTPPGTISNLTPSNPTASSITLSWTAPGDDGVTGTATSYDIRRSASIITEANWSSATQISGEPTPQAVGASQSMVINGLTSGTTYFFAMKTSDEIPNVSTISNSPSAATLTPSDTTAPAAVTNLTASNPTASSITLSWTAPGDDGSSGQATSYDVRYSTTLITTANWSSASQATGEPIPKTAGGSETMTISGLAQGTTYYFAMKTSDEVPNISALSNVASAATQVVVDTNPPAVTLTVQTADKMFTLNYPATDPESNTPISYKVVISDNQALLNGMTLSQFDNPPVGSAPLSPDAPFFGYHIYSLAPDHTALANVPNGTTYYFRVRACDNANNCAMSNTSGGSPSYQTISSSVSSSEIVYDWTTQKCENLDIPDNPARFFKNNDGSLTLIAGNAPNEYITKASGFSAAALTAPGAHICSPALTSTDDIYPHTFKNQEWIFATYKEGGTVHAIIHNEYHDPFPASDPPCTEGVTDTTNRCWYNTLTYAASTNEGLSFIQNFSPPNNLIAAAPDPWNPSAILEPYGTGFHLYGYQQPTNIVKKDGYYYSIFVKDVDPDKALAAKSGHCLMRTNNLASPSSWRAWNGKQFSYVMDAPYTYPAGTPDAITGSLGCEPLSFDALSGYTLQNVTYNTYLQKYIAVGVGIVGANCGFFFTISPDLVTWSSPYFLMNGKVGYGTCWDGNFAGLTPYPSFVDRSDTSINFENTDATFDVYYTYWNINGLDRDLRRNAVTISTP